MTRVVDYLLPETASAPAAARKRYAWRSTLAAFVFGVCAGLSFVQGERAVLLLSGLPVILYMVWEFTVLMRALDELQFRIHMTALAIAGGAVCTILTLIGVVDLVWPLPAFGIVFALPALVPVYYLALFVLSRRYA